MKVNALASWLTTLFVAIVLPSPAFAYIGPGAGLSAIGTVVAVIGAFFLLIVGFVWYPVKRVLRRRKANADTANDEPADRAS